MNTSEAAGTAADQRRRRPTRRLAAIVAAVVVVVAGGTYLGVRLSSGTGPPTSGLATMWTAHSLVGDSCSSAGMPWIADGLAVACSGNGVLAGYGLRTGRVAWEWHTPKAPSSLLAGPEGQAGQAYPSILRLSASTDNGVGVFDYTYGSGPAGIDGIDIATGRQLWHLPPSVASADGAQFWAGNGRFDVVTAARDGAGGPLQVRNLATGALDWSSASKSIPAVGCDVEDAAITGPWIYAVTHCANGDDQLYQMALQNGSVLAQTGLQDGSCVAASDYPTLWAADGYVLSGCTGAPTAPATPDVIIIPAGGVQQRTLPWTSTGAHNYIENLSEGLSPPGMAISGSTLYIGQNLLLRNNDEVNQIAAIDLTTARLRWYKTIYWGEQSTNRHSEIQGEDPNNALFPVSVIGAGPNGVIDVIESVGGTGGDDIGTTGMTLALLSASDGSMSYGPGTTYPAGIDNQPSFTLAGNVLLSFPVCPTADCTGGKYTGTVTAYSTGSWPG